jgi:hypothetical protein
VSRLHSALVLIAVATAATASTWPRGAVATLVLCAALAYAGARRAALAAAIAMAVLSLHGALLRPDHRAPPGPPTAADRSDAR